MVHRWEYLLLVFPRGEGVSELPEESFRHLVVVCQPVGCGPSVRQIVRTENTIQNGQVDREIFVDGLLLRAVMPMMKRRSGQERSQPSKFPPHVGVNERRLDHHPRNV